MSLDLAGRRVRGTVLDTVSSLPVADATIRLYAARSQSRRSRRGGARTNASGTFDMLIAPVERGRDAIDVYHKDYLPSVVDLRSGSETLEVRLSPRPRFAGVVRLEDGRPAAGAEIRIQLMSTAGELTRDRRDDADWETQLAWFKAGRRGDPRATEVRADSTIATNRDGRFDTALAFSGTVYGVVSYPGYRSESLKLGPSSYAQPVEVTLRASNMKGGRLRVLRADGTPLRGVMVWVQEDVVGLKQRTLLAAKTDKDGWIGTAALTEGEKTRITISPDPDDPKSDKSPSPYPFDWIVKHTDEIIVRAPK